MPFHFTCQQCGSSFTKRQRFKVYANGTREPFKYCSKPCYETWRDSQPLADRFWLKVDQSGGPDSCWPWLAGKFNDGYGSFSVQVGDGIHTERRAHVVAWELANEKPMPDGMLGCHTCDNPPCCNPSHVFPGTPLTNAQDRDAKGRGIPKGRKRITKPHLTKSQIRDMRQRRDDGETRLSLSIAFGVSEKQVTRVVSHKSWRNVD